MRKISEKAFTMIEMFVVLTIIGVVLLVIISANELIEEARKKRVVSDFKTYRSAFTQFIEKYDGIPGDISNAERYLGAANTNNGTGNAIINENPTIDFDEGYLAWQHLALADLIDGVYSGTDNGPDPLEVDNVAIGGNLPAAPYTATVRASFGGASGYIINSIGLPLLKSKHTYVSIGYATTAIDTILGGAVVPPEDAEWMDRTFDDDITDSGIIRYLCIPADNDACRVRYYLTDDGPDGVM